MPQAMKTATDEQARKAAEAIRYQQRTADHQRWAHNAEYARCCVMNAKAYPLPSKAAQADAADVD